MCVLLAVSQVAMRLIWHFEGGGGGPGAGGGCNHTQSVTANLCS